MSSLMYLVLVMRDASIVTVLLCLKVNSCQIVKKTHSKCTLEIEMKGKHIGILLFMSQRNSKV